MDPSKLARLRREAEASKRFNDCLPPHPPGRCRTHITDEEILDLLDAYEDRECLRKVVTEAVDNAACSDQNAHDAWDELISLRSRVEELETVVGYARDELHSFSAPHCDWFALLRARGLLDGILGPGEPETKGK